MPKIVAKTVKIDTNKPKSIAKAVKIKKPTDKETIAFLKSELSIVNILLDKTTKEFTEVKNSLAVVPFWVVAFFKFFR